MTSYEQDDFSDHLYLNPNLNLNDHIEHRWRPMDGVGQISDEQFVGNYMIDSDKSVNHFFYNYFSTNFI
jgi:hypothetical protein